jgi:hypothetical protein
MAAFGLVTWIVIPAQRREGAPRQDEARKGRTRRGALRIDWLPVLFTAVTLVWLTVCSQTLYGLPLRFAGVGIAPVGFGVIAALAGISAPASS